MNPLLAPHKLRENCRRGQMRARARAFHNWPDIRHGEIRHYAQRSRGTTAGHSEVAVEGIIPESIGGIGFRAEFVFKIRTLAAPVMREFEY